MANLKEVRNRITSVSSTKQITSAMKMVSAAKLRRAQDAILKMRPYAQKLQEILVNLSSSLDTAEGVYAQQREVKNVLIIAISSNRGLCGAFNANVIKRVNKLAREDYSTANVSVLSVGKKADDYFKKTELNIKGSRLHGNFNYIYDELTFDNAAPIAEKLMDVFRLQDYDKVVMVYNSFRNPAVQQLTVEQLLPVEPPELKEDEKQTQLEYIFEPSKSEIVTELIPNSIKTQFYKALLDSQASEHGARMTAMHQATDNATELLKELRLNYNKARQAAITTEILEIVSGAEALSGGK